MLKKFLASVAVLAMVAGASAAGVVSLVPVDNSDAAGFTDVAVPVAPWVAAGYLTYDLKIDTQGQKWTTAYNLATLTNGTFFNHPNAGSAEMFPNPANFAFFGLTQYDSFYTGMNAYPALAGDLTGAPAAAPGSPIQNGASVREMEWYDNPSLDNIGVFTIARFTFLATEPWTLHVVGTTTTVEDAAAAPYDITVGIPEPTSLALLALGGLALLRRR